jgi:hypothetical protein
VQVLVDARLAFPMLDLHAHARRVLRAPLERAVEREERRARAGEVLRMTAIG